MTASESGTAVRQGLAARGVAWPAPVVALDAVGSTNEWLKETARHGAPEWTTVIAATQSGGRGREGHGWESPRGNLFLSTLLRPALAPTRLTLLPLAVGVAIAEALDEWVAGVQLKWPNDLRVGERKIGGILAEAISGPAGIEAVVVGVGVNVGLSPDEVPAELRDSATSILMEAGREVAVAAVAVSVLARIATWYGTLLARGAAGILPAWRARSLPWWGQDVEVRCAGQVVRGRARDVDDSGALLLETAGGATRVIMAGEARALRLS